MRPNIEAFSNSFLIPSIRRPKLANNVRFMALLGLVLGLLVLSVALLSGWGWLGLPFLANFSFLTSSSMVMLSSMALGAVLGCLPTAGKVIMDYCTRSVQNPPGNGAPSSVVSNHVIKSGNNQTAAPSATSAAMSILGSKPKACEAIHSSQPLGGREMPSANKKAPNPTTLTPLRWVPSTLNVPKLSISTTPFGQFKQPPPEDVFGSTGSVPGGVILGRRR